MTLILLFTTLSHTIKIEWQTTFGRKYAYDFLLSWDWSESYADFKTGIDGAEFWNSSTYPIPKDPQVSAAGVTQPDGVFTIYNGTISSVSGYSYRTQTGAATETFASLVITFKSDSSEILLVWGGHISSQADCGAGNSAVNIRGAPYHMTLKQFDGAAVGE